MAARYIQGVQHHSVVATAKHYNLNAQEENRLMNDAQIDERTLQEIYTLLFAIAVQDGHVGAVMGAFNKVNGVHCCENPHLLTEILRQQLGFTGWVIIDFESTHSTVESANAGLDVEIPAAKFFGDPLLQAVQEGQVSLATIDDKVHRILHTMFAFGLFDSPVQISPLPIEEHGQRARDIANQGMVLLKNAGELLPLSSHELHSIAVIGADADHYITGGGSAFTSFAYAQLQVEPETTDGTSPIRVSFTITNTGIRVGAETPTGLPRLARKRR